MFSVTRRTKKRGPIQKGRQDVETPLGDESGELPGYWLPLMLIFLAQLVSVLSIDSQAWRLLAPLATAFIVGWYMLWLGLDLIYGRLRRALELADLDSLPSNPYLQKKIKYLRSAPREMLANSRLKLEDEVGPAEMVVLAKYAQHSIHAISYSGESRNWQGYYDRWIHENQERVKQGTIVERLFVLSQDDLSKRSVQVIEEIRKNFYLPESMENSGLKCYWIPMEFLEHCLGSTEKPDFTLIDHPAAIPLETGLHTLLIRNMDLVPMRRLEVIWDDTELTRSLQLWQRLMAASRLITAHEIEAEYVFEELHKVGLGALNTAGPEQAISAFLGR